MKQQLQTPKNRAFKTIAVVVTKAVTLRDLMDCEVHDSLLCSSLPPRVCSNSCPSNHLIISHPLLLLSSIGPLHPVAKVLEVQLQYQSF